MFGGVPMTSAKYQGYKGYGNSKSRKNIRKQEDYVIDQLPEVKSDLISESAMNVGAVFNLAKFLENSNSDPSFPEVTVIPDVLRSVGKFVNERKKMKYAHLEFQEKMRFLSDGIDKQYQIEMMKIANETEIQLAQIQGNVRIQIEKIDRYYDLEMQRLLAEYNLRHEEMNLYYEDLEKQRQEQAKRFKRMMKLATIDRKKAKKAIEEAEEVAKFFKKKIYENTATRAEREHYMELLKFRIEGVNMITNIIPQLAAKIK